MFSKKALNIPFLLMLCLILNAILLFYIRILVPSLLEKVLQDIKWHKIRQEESASNPTETDSSISSKDTSAIDSVIWANLSPFLPVNPIPTQAYNIPGADLAKSINALYEEIITWRKNLFPIPFGQQGKSHTVILSEWLTLYNNTSFQGIALKVFMVIPALMMQTPFSTTPPFKELL